MPYFVIAVLVLIVIVFGVSSTSQSYAMAQQAKAQIETAQLGQISAWGNLITMLTLALIIVVVLTVLMVALYWFFNRAKGDRKVKGKPFFPQDTENQSPRIDTSAAISQLLQLETLKLLSSINTKPGEPRVLIDAPKEDDEIPWLR